LFLQKTESNIKDQTDFVHIKSIKTMLGKILDRFLIILFAIFLVVSAFYNIGYFTIVGGSLGFFFQMPIIFLYVLKTGFGAIIPLALILMVFKPILIDPIFNRIYPGD
jgi:hypothetical protein